MPKEIIKILGQLYPAAGATELLYVVPDNRRAIVKITIFVNGGANDNVSIAMLPLGETLSIKNYLIANLSALSKLESQMASATGITLSEGDQILVKSTVGDTIFHCYGVEIEP